MHYVFLKLFLHHKTNYQQALFVLSPFLVPTFNEVCDVLHGYNASLLCLAGLGRLPSLPVAQQASGSNSVNELSDQLKDRRACSVTLWNVFGSGDTVSNGTNFTTPVVEFISHSRLSDNDFCNTNHVLTCRLCHLHPSVLKQRQVTATHNRRNVFNI